MVKTLSRGKLVSFSYQMSLLNLDETAWICLNAAGSDTATSVGEIRTIGPYFLCRLSM